MSHEAGKEKKQQESGNASNPELAEAIEKIKQPPSIDQTLRDQSKEELLSNPVAVPEMLTEPGDLRGDLKRSE